MTDLELGMTSGRCEVYTLFSFAFCLPTEKQSHCIFTSSSDALGLYLHHLVYYLRPLLRIASQTLLLRPIYQCARHLQRANHFLSAHTHLPASDKLVKISSCIAAIVESECAC